MKINSNQLDRGFMKYKEEYLKAVEETLDSGRYVLGERVEKFENSFKQFIGTRYCVGLNSGLDALTLAFRALDIKENDEVIVPANTYIASLIGVTENRAVPILVEPDEFYNINADRIEEKITKNTRAILSVHLYGQAANMQKIMEISIKHNLYLIEDCAQSHGARFKEKLTGNWGDIGCFSFYPTKNMGAFGDAGAIVTNDEKIYEKIKTLRNYGSKVKYHNDLIGVNSRLDEMQAALLSVKLSHYSELRKEREIVINRYLNGLRTSRLLLPSLREGSESVWHQFVVRVEDRVKFRRLLEKHGIETSVHYPIPPHLSKAYEYLGFKKGDFPITEEYSNTMVSLPLYDGITEKEVDYVIGVANRYIG